MKLLSTIETLATLTSSGDTSGYPASNVKDLEPMLRWWADAYTGEVWLKVDFGSAKTLTALFVNQANFPHFHAQGNASDSWSTPSFDLGCDLVVDDAANRKGWFDLTAFNYRWLRILIPASQTLDEGTVPKVGNVIVGAAVALPVVESLEVTLQQRKKSFEADGGGYFEAKKGRPRHIIQVGVNDTLALIRSMNKTWDSGVFFADLGNAGESWLVMSPSSWGKPIVNGTLQALKFTLNERT